MDCMTVLHYVSYSSLKGWYHAAMSCRLELTPFWFEELLLVPVGSPRPNQQLQIWPFVKSLRFQSLRTLSHWRPVFLPKVFVDVFSCWKARLLDPSPFFRVDASVAELEHQEIVDVDPPAYCPYQPPSHLSGPPWSSTALAEILLPHEEPTSYSTVGQPCTNWTGKSARPWRDTRHCRIAFEPSANDTSISEGDCQSFSLWQILREWVAPPPNSTETWSFGWSLSDASALNERSRLVASFTNAVSPIDGRVSSAFVVVLDKVSAPVAVDVLLPSPTTASSWRSLFPPVVPPSRFRWLHCWFSSIGFCLTFGASFSSRFATTTPPIAGRRTSCYRAFILPMCCCRTYPTPDFFVRKIWVKILALLPIPTTISSAPKTTLLGLAHRSRIIWHYSRLASLVLGNILLKSLCWRLFSTSWIRSAMNQSVHFSL